MIFSIGNHIEQIINGTKTQTRRLFKGFNKLSYNWFTEYAIQPCRTCKGISDGKIKMVDIGFEERGVQITKEDALAEGNYTPEEYEKLFDKMYPGWEWRTVYRFIFIPNLSLRSSTKEEEV